VALALVAWFWSQALIASRGLHSDAIHDVIHDLSAPLHRYLVATPRAARTLLIVSSVAIDIFGVFLIAAGVFGPSLRPVVALLILFALRQVCQALCALPTPPGMIWRHPGFPSLLVTYGVGNDFFFSGHTAVATLGALEMARLGPWWLGVAAACVALGEVATVLVLRAHYTMDILAALAATWCAVCLATWLCALL
jgi:membrane-associated phospholipid phosphatase